MYSFIESVPRLNSVSAGNIFIATAVQILLRENSVEDLLNAPPEKFHVYGGCSFRLVGLIAQDTVTLLWTVHTPCGVASIGKAQTTHAGSLGIKF